MNALHVSLEVCLFLERLVTDAAFYTPGVSMNTLSVMDQVLWLQERLPTDVTGK